MQWLEIAGDVAKSLTTIFALVALFVKPVREWILGLNKEKQKHQQTEEAGKEALRSLIRAEIVRIYYKNRQVKALHQYEYENLIALYGAYTALSGNSFVQRIMEEMEEWEIIP